MADSSWSSRSRSARVSTKPDPPPRFVAAFDPGIFVRGRRVRDVNVQVYGPLRSATGSKTVEIDPGSTPDRRTVRDVLDALCAAHPRAGSHLRDEEGSLRPSVRVTVGGDRADLDDDCPADAEVRVFPAMRGG